MRRTYIYQFTEKDGQCELVARAEANLAHIDKILGKAKVRGKREEFERIYLRSRYSDIKGEFLTERKNLTIPVVEFFIQNYYGGDRTVGNHPYYSDLYDDELLDDLGIEVLTYKRFYPMGSGLCTCFWPCKKDLVTDSLMNKLCEWTEKAEEEKREWDKRIADERERDKLSFEPYRGSIR